ncbi:MAG: TIGR00266 family protein [Oscillospiraceae bacterium]|nr:TIGR00266 family protein [Oscillospiraceae bacterium]
MNYEIQGNPYPVAVIKLENGESVVCQRGAMTWMTPNMVMQTTGGGSIGRMFSRAISGESMFQNIYTAQGGEGLIAFGSSVPGEIMPIEITPNQTIIAQKSAFLASSQSVNYELFFQKKISTGFFGGEGFIMQRFFGSGMLFLEIDGSVISYTLEPNQSLLIDTGYLAAMDSTCSIEVEAVKGVGNALLGGEGFFNTKVTGPGRVWLQTMPIAQMASSIGRYIPSKG